MTRLAPAFAVLACFLADSASAEPLKVDRTIGKQPAYRTKDPRYGLLAFGPDGKDRVWLVLDGDTLYVDRNGNGNLTDPGERITAEKQRGRDPREYGYTFDVGDVTVGGRIHKGLRIGFTPLKLYTDSSVGANPHVKAALAKDPAALAASIGLDVDVPGIKGGGVGGRLVFLAGLFDLTGVLQFAATPAAAPVVHLGGPLQVTFYGEPPTLRAGRDSEFTLVVGTPGIGPGTFASIGYEGAIPEAAKPVAELSLRMPGPVPSRYARESLSNAAAEP